MKGSIIRIKLFFLMLVLTSSINFSQNDPCDKTNNLQKISGNPSGIRFNINNIATWFNNNGISDEAPDFNSGFEFPKGSGKYASYSSSLLWGGKVNGEVRVGGCYYRSGLQPGKILSDGKAENPDNDNVRIYRVRPDYKTSSFETEIMLNEGVFEGLKFSYEKDWNKWPANDGAPYQDVNKNGNYEPDIDIAGVQGADQTLWFIANDLNPTNAYRVAGSGPVGIEMRGTVWGYNKNNYLDNVVFRKYQITNRSNKTIYEVYLNLFSDVDLGGAGDDLAGSDSTLNLGYVYNSDNIDSHYQDKQPALGFVLLQGPVINAPPSEMAMVNGALVKGKKNLPMTAFFHFYCGGPGWYCPTPGHYLRGTLAWYNYFQGIEGLTNQPFMIPEQFGGGTTMYSLSGDPVTGQGWLDGVVRPAGDRYINLTSGPFNLAPGETQEIVFAQMIYAGNDRLHSIQLLKEYAAQVMEDYKNDIYKYVYATGVEENEIPNNFVLYQNYPNPFNPTTTIKYSIPAESNQRAIFTTLKIYDLLGSEVASLVNEIKSPGNYEVKFNAGKLPSGIYFYRLQSGGFMYSRKMLLIK
ncbi:MAG: T9SS type A sorting domain-containing protein [Melioribacteraceae bacterium]|nr:T9SS type A sorting domain-containing protein [Melioribacteraceae bacterium]